MSDTTIDAIITKLRAGKDPDTGELHITEQEAKSALYDLILKEVIGLDNEHRRDMPIPDPDPFALPSDHQNQLRRYQRQKAKELFNE